MLAMLAMLVPPVFMAVLWNKLFFGKEERKTKNNCLVYLCCLMAVNFTAILITSYIRDEPGNIAYNINNSGIFALKYMLLTNTIAFAVPYIIKLIRQNFTFQSSMKLPCAAAIRKASGLYFYTSILVLLNFIRIFDNSFWGDEAFSIKLAQMSLSQMLPATAGDVHPPLYYIFMIAAFKIFGKHGFVFHLVSFLPYFISVIFVLTVIRKRFGRCVSALFITFASLLQNAVQYNVEVRMYSWASLFVLLSFYSLYLVISYEKTLYYILLAAASLAAAYCHYYAMLSVAFFYLGLLLLAIHRRKSLKKIGMLYLSAVIGYMPWLLTMIKTFKRTAEGFWMTNVSDFSSSIRYFFETDKEWFSFLLFALTLCFLALVVLYDSKIISIKKSNGKINISISEKKTALSDLSWWLIFGVFSATGTIILGELVSYAVRPVYMLRYIYPAASVMWLVISVCVSKLNLRRLISCIILVVTLFICLPQYGLTYKTDKEINSRCKNTQKTISDQLRPDTVILTNGAQMEWTILDYYFPETTHQLMDESFHGFDNAVSFCLVWTEHLEDNKNALDYFEKNGYSPNEILHDGILGNTSVHIYRLTKTD